MGYIGNFIYLTVLELTRLGGCVEFGSRISCRQGPTGWRGPHVTITSRCFSSSCLRDSRLGLSKSTLYTILNPPWVISSLHLSGHSDRHVSKYHALRRNIFHTRSFLLVVFVRASSSLLPFESTCLNHVTCLRLPRIFNNAKNTCLKPTLKKFEYPLTN